MIRNIDDLKRKLERFDHDNYELVIWGVGYYGIMLYFCMKQIGREIKGFCDNEPSKWHTNIYDKKICYSPQELSGGVSVVLIGVKEKKAQNAIARQVIQMGGAYIDNLQNMFTNCMLELQDDLYVKCFWYRAMGYELDLKNPRTINEKLQCLKLGVYYNNPIITACCDKVLVKDYVRLRESCCKVAKTYGVFDRTNDINWGELPDRFVIKCNHGCGYNIVCRDKAKLDMAQTVKQLKEWLDEDYWKLYAETQYKFIKKKILIEEYLGNDIQTYKFYCFNGVPRILYISHNGDRMPEEQDRYVDYYDMDFVWQDITLGKHEHVTWKMKKPNCWDEMVKVSKEISKDFPFVRVDLYDVNGEVYLSELTFFPTGGYMDLKPKCVVEQWGEWLVM